MRNPDNRTRSRAQSNSAEIRFGLRAVSSQEACFVIAEAGVNHNGDVSLAEELVRQAKDAGADCVKFQTFTPSELVTRSAPKAAYQLENTDPAESQLEMLEKLALPSAAYPRLLQLCRELGILFLSTPYTFTDVDFLDSLGVDAFKVASAQLVEPVFLRHVASKGRPIILSTGMGTFDEVSAAVAAIRSTSGCAIILLQCTTNYPAPEEDSNLLAMTTMADAFGCLVGYSDHTQTSITALGAVALGACIVEKHFTLDKSMAGPDHSSSLDPRELRDLVAQIRTLEAALGNGKKVPSEIERRNTIAMRRSLVAARDLRAGEQLTEAMLALKRPATGIPASAWDAALGRRLIKDLAADSILTWDDLTNG